MDKQKYNIFMHLRLPTCLAQISNTNFPQGNLAMKPKNQDCKDCKTHDTKKTKNKKRKTRLQDP